MQTTIKRKPITKETVGDHIAHHIGATNGVTCHNLVTEITGLSHGIEGHKRQVRSYIVELRNEGLPICGKPETGYFMAATPEELENTARFLFNRAMTGLKQVAAMKRKTLPDLAGQLEIKLGENQ